MEYAEVLSPEKQITGETMLGLIRRDFEIRRHISEMEVEVHKAGEPIRSAVANLAFANVMPGERFDFNSLSPSIKEANANRARLQAHLDYMNADFEATYQDTEQRINEALIPTWQTVKDDEFGRKDIWPRLWVTKLVDNPRDINFRRAIYFRNARPLSMLSYREWRDSSDLIYKSIDRGGHIYLTKRHDPEGSNGEFKVLPFDPVTLEPLVKISISYQK